MQNNINSNKYILNIKFGELSEFGTPCQSLVTNSGAIPEESNHSGAIPADSGHSCGFRCHSGGFRCHSGGITGFRMESVGHCKVLRLGTSTPQPQADEELSATPATSFTTSGAILIPDSDSEDEEGKGKHPIGNVIVISDSDDDSALPQKPYPSHPAPLSFMPGTPLKGIRRFKPLFEDGYNQDDFFNADGDPDNVAVSPNAPSASLRARQLEKIEKYMKMPSTLLQARSAARRAARVPKSYVDSNAASTSALPQDDNDEIDYGIPEFNAAGLQELDAILDSLSNGA